MNMSVMVDGLRNLRLSTGARDVVPPHPLEAYKYLRENSGLRKKSFQNWPSKYSFIEVDDLVDDGFHYIGKGETDKVQCAFCGGILYGFEENDNVHMEHYKNFPNCSRFRVTSCGQNFSLKSPETDDGDLECDADDGDLECDGPEAGVSASSSHPDGFAASKPVKISRDPKHKYYTLEKDRLKTFKTWPKESCQKPEVLAKVGLFYRGKDDLVECYFCGGSLDMWEEGDNPQTEHDKFFHDICPLANRPNA